MKLLWIYIKMSIVTILVLCLSLSSFISCGDDDSATRLFDDGRSDGLDVNDDDDDDYNDDDNSDDDDDDDSDDDDDDTSDDDDDSDWINVV